MLITKLIKDVPIGHIVPFHNKCGRLHGHNYDFQIVLEISDEEFQKKEDGFVRDFGEVKKVVKEYIDTHLDHRFIIPSKCKNFLVRREDELIEVTIKRDKMGSLSLTSFNQDEFIELPIKQSTAECLSDYMTKFFKGIFPELKAIKVFEQSDSAAIYT